MTTNNARSIAAKKAAATRKANKAKEPMPCDELDTNQTKLKAIGKKLFRAGLESCVGRNYSAELLTLLSNTLHHRLSDSAPLAAFVDIAGSQETVIGGGEYGEDINIPRYETRDVIFALESIFNAAVNRVAAAERRHESDVRTLARQQAKAKDIRDETPTDKYAMDAADRPAVADYIEALDVLHLACSEVWNAYASRFERARRHTLPYGSEVTDSILGERQYAFDYDTARAMSDRYATTAKRVAALDARVRAQALNIDM
ncbi:hypothetical protein GCM10023116_19310 [Kistimonas scapharcae]|uniref:Uncharacterized protein n=1 Tax=Kistimonas scapharcae TaxID=1036133 RepID=A0ABP8V0B0_9GAMM